MPRRKKELPARTLAEVIEVFPHYRQTILGIFDNCSLSARFALEGTPYTNARMAAGIIFHRTAAEILRTLRTTGEVRMPVEEALQILYEVSAQRDMPPDEIVTVPARERRLLRIAIIRLVATNRFRMKRLIAVERRLATTVTYDDDDGNPVERTLTGQPDALIADPATVADPVSGAIVLDWKMSLKAPPEGEPDDHWDSPHNLSYMGYFQQRMYGLLVLRNYPSVQRVRLREFYPLEGVARYGTVYRQDMEHLEREFALLAQGLDAALMEGSRSARWNPSPGKHCAMCPRPTRCPIEADVRAREGGIATWPEAVTAAAEYTLVKQIGTTLHKALRDYMEESGGDGRHDYIPVRSAKGRYGVGFYDTAAGKRFGAFVVPTSDRGPMRRDPELDEAFAESAARAR